MRYRDKSGVAWKEESPTLFRFSHYGKVQRRRGGWYAVLSSGAESGPFRAQQRARNIIEEYAAPIQEQDRIEAEWEAKRATEDNRVEQKRRLRKHETVGVGAYPWPSKLKCEACGVVMCDSEPMGESGQYDHPHNGCRNAGKTFDNFPRQGRYQNARGIAPVMPSRFRRAKRRGAKLASRYRPR